LSVCGAGGPDPTGEAAGQRARAPDKRATTSNAPTFYNSNKQRDSNFSLLGASLLEIQPRRVWLEQF